VAHALFLPLFMMDGPGDPGPEYVALCESDARAAVARAKLVGYDFN